MRKRKISADQFVLDCINKQYEICGSSYHFDTIQELIEYTKQYDETHKNDVGKGPKRSDRWFYEFHYKSKDQVDKVKEYFMTHFYDWQPKYIRKSIAEREWSWFWLDYGFMTDYD